jgi:fatty-acyl-CoA synthase
MRALMMDMPLSIISLLRHAAINHGEAEIVSRTVEGPLHRYTYRDCYDRVQRLAHALQQLGIKTGDRVATLAWNGYRHFELYYAISGIGAVCHTVNPRLSIEQIAYILDHAQDKLVFVDSTFVPLLETLSEKLPGIGAYVIMTDAAHMRPTALPTAHCYEALVDGGDACFSWPRFDENTASSLCYTSGTTGEPKGTLYSHRSTVLHALAACFPDNFAYSSRDTVLPVVPLFHVNAWGVPYACPMVGAKLVFPGPWMDSQSIYAPLEDERVTFALGVPTIWSMLLEYLRTSGKKLSSLKRVTSGGSAVPKSMIAAFEDEFGVEMRQGWGMTEMSPIGLQGTLKGSQINLGRDAQLTIKSKQGRPVYGVETRIVDASGKEMPRDGRSFGELCVRGPWVLSQYYRNDVASAAAFDKDGWFHTGDVSTIDPDGFVQIVDRTKDVIKSGGEWVSSIEIENVALAHDDVAEAGVIGIPHTKWGERPLLILVVKDGRTIAPAEILSFLRNRLAKISIPDDVVFLDELPRTPTGKILKTRLRERFRDHWLPTG